LKPYPQSSTTSFLPTIYLEKKGGLGILERFEGWRTVQFDALASYVNTLRTARSVSMSKHRRTLQPPFSLTKKDKSSDLVEHGGVEIVSFKERHAAEE
jgi:hypothetical protein